MTGDPIDDLDDKAQAALRDEVSGLFVNEAMANGPLDDIGFPRALRPLWQVNSASVWREVFAQLGAGVVEPPPFRRLLEAVAKVFPYNPTFVRLLAEAPSAAAPPPPVGFDRTTPLDGPWAFVSYGHANQDYATALAADLDRRGVRVWIDHDIPPASQWTAVLRDRIAGAGAVVVVMTPEAEASRWVDRELQQAEDARKPIFPLLLEGRRFMRLNTTQYEDVSGARMPSDRLVADLKATLDTP